MLTNRFFRVGLIFILWLSLAGFRSAPDHLRALTVPPLAQASLTKLSPINLAANQPLNQVVLSWQGADLPGTAIYQYCLRTNRAACPKSKWVSVGKNTSVTLFNLQPNLTYKWQVRAIENETSKNVLVEADGGAWFTFSTIVVTSLPGPFGKTAPADAAINQPVNGLTLSWTTSAGATSYQYCYDTVDNDLCDLAGGWINNGPATTAVLYNLAYEIPYFWQVRAVNAAGPVEANSGAWDSFITQPAPPQAFNKTLPADAAFDQPTSLTLTWETSVGTNVTYEYCIDESNDNACQTGWVSASGLTSAAPAGLLYETIYYWQVRASNSTAAVNANGGNWFSFATRVAPPGGFSKSAPGNGAANQPLALTLSWSDSPGSGVNFEYCIYPTSVKSCDDPSAIWIPVGKQKSVEVSGLSYATPYHWQVRAVNPATQTYANGSAGAQWVFTTQSAPPEPFYKLSPQQNALDQSPALYLSWSESAGATGYQYCVSQTSGTCGAWQNSGTATGVSLASLSLDYAQTYYWQVRAVNATLTVEADGGGWWSFTTHAAPAGEFHKTSPGAGAVYQALQPWLYWTGSSDQQVKYQYCVSSSAACPSGWTDVGSELSGQVAVALDRKSTYYWQVRAYTVNHPTEDQFTYADGGAWNSFTTLPDLPTCSSSQSVFTTDENTALLNGHLDFNIAPTIGHPTITLTGRPPAGSLTLLADGYFNYTPVPYFATVPGYSEAVTFQYTVSDGYNPPSTPCTATITVNPVNQLPVIEPLTNWKVKPNTQISFSITVTDHDTPYGDVVTLSVDPLTLPAGAVFNPARGSFSWKPGLTPSYIDPFTIVFVATDQTQTPVTQSTSVTLTPERLFLPILYH